MRRKGKWVNTNKEKKLITVMTPTYNRAAYLYRCYSCLKEQTNKNFEWLIVDDGSTDNTKNEVKKIRDSATIPIRYIYKENGGKHTAVNLGVKNIDTILTVILDSDDLLDVTAIDEIEKLHNWNCDRPNICGYSFLKKYPDGRYMGDSFPVEGEYNFIDWRVNYVVSGDQCDVFYTKYMKEFPFSEYPGERFIGESTAWIRMAKKYNMICKNVAIYIADYLEDGLTKSGRSLRMNCPRGGMEYANLCMMKGISWKRRVKSAILYTAYGLIAKESLYKLVSRSNAKGLCFLLFPIGALTQHQWKRKFRGK